MVNLKKGHLKKEKQPTKNWKQSETDIKWCRRRLPLLSNTHSHKGMNKNTDT